VLLLAGAVASLFELAVLGRSRDGCRAAMARGDCEGALAGSWSKVGDSALAWDLKLPPPLVVADRRRLPRPFSGLAAKRRT
jgi:hypothetical protein